MVSVIDLHCDLLSYLMGSPERTPDDLEVRCAIPQLRQGHVKLQVLAIFTQTGHHSSEKGLAQAKIYHTLPIHYPQEFIHFTLPWNMQSFPIGTLMAFENASGFCDEHEPLQQGLDRLKRIIQEIARPFYISLTWNTENRFGGGALTQVGLKADGQRLLDELHEQRIAVDLSHASDALADDMIDYIEGQGLKIPLIASHSNARSITHVPRNLTDELAREIFRRQGLIGLNLYRPFIGETEENFVKHLAHWIELGGENHIALGADFFYQGDLPSASLSTYQQKSPPFFESYQDASCYGRLLTFLQRELKVESSFSEKLAYRNALSFIERGHL